MLGNVTIYSPVSRTLTKAERHKAINWLLGYDEVYSEVDTST